MVDVGSYKEDACSTKLGLAEAATIYGVAGGVVTGLAMYGLTGLVIPSVLTGGAVCAAPIAVYKYLHAKYKPLFSEKRFSWVETYAEDKAFYYTMMLLSPVMLPTIVSMMALPGTLVGVGLGMPAACTAVLGGASTAVVLAAMKTHGHQYVEPNNTWTETLTNFKNHLVGPGEGGVLSKLYYGLILSAAALGGTVLAQNLLK